MYSVSCLLFRNDWRMSAQEVLLMKRIRKNWLKYLFASSLFILFLFYAAASSFAAATDEILNFTITVDVNQDASLNMTYHIDWKVLDDSIGKLEWIDLGVPNSYHESIFPHSDTIDRIEDNGNSFAIYLDRPYGENETVSIDFSMIQDHMYQIDKWRQGETVYSFTPAWFDGMDVDELTIRWNADNAGAWQPDCIQEDGYLVFTASLSAGERYTMMVVYPNDAFGFDIDRQYSDESYTDNTVIKSSNDENGFGAFVFLMVVLAIMIAVFVQIRKFFTWLLGGTGFGSGTSTEK